MKISEIAPLIQSLPERKKQIAAGTLSVVAGLAILIGYFQSGPNALSYAQAEAAISKWVEAPQDDSLYQAMKESIRSIPALEKKYEATIAQALINTDRMNEALLMANRSLERVKDEIPFHAAFAQTSLLIEQGHFQQALENAVALKESMGPAFLASNRGGSLLYAHNLLRIACLHRELNNRPGEMAAWKEVEALLAAKTPLTNLLLSSFSEKRVSLAQYIAERKKVLL